MAITVPQRARQRLTPINVGDPRGAFGEPQADAAAKGAKALGDLGKRANQFAIEQQGVLNRQADREDALSRAQTIEKARRDAAKAVEEAQTGGGPGPSETGAPARPGIHTKDGIDALNNRLSETFQKASDGYQPRRDQNKAQFEIELEKLKSGVTLNAREMHINSSRKFMDKMGAQKLSELNQLLSENPQALPTVQQEFKDYVTSTYGPTMPGPAVEAFYAIGMQSFAKNQIDFYINVAGEAGHEQARQLMADPEFTKYLDLDGSGATIRSYNVKMWQVEGARRKATADAEAKIATFEAAMGKSMTPAMRARVIPQLVAGFSIDLDGPKATRTKMNDYDDAQKISLATRGRPMSEEETAKFWSYGVKDDPHGSGTYGKALDFTSSNAQRFANGTLTQDEAREFLTHVNVLATHVDPLTKAKSTVPILIREALAQQGIADYRSITDPAYDGYRPSATAIISGFPSTAGVPADTTQAAKGRAAQVAPSVSAPPDGSAERAATVQRYKNEADTLSKIGATVSAGELSDPGSYAQSLRDSQFSYYNSMENIMGPVSSMQAGVASVPYIGKWLSFDAVVKARSAAKLLPMLIADTIDLTTREGTGEQKRLEEKYKEFEASFFTEPDFARNSLRGLDEMLGVLQDGYRIALQDEGSVDSKRYRDLKNKINKINLTRRVMGVPPKYTAGKGTTQDDFAKWWWSNGMRQGDKVEYTFNGQTKIVTINQPIPKPKGWKE